jgi:hypothetical protein
MEPKATVEPKSSLISKIKSLFEGYKPKKAIETPKETPTSTLPPDPSTKKA